MQSVVTGQAPVTLEWNITSGEKSYFEVLLQLKYFIVLICTLLLLSPNELSAVSYVWHLSEM